MPHMQQAPKMAQALRAVRPLRASGRSRSRACQLTSVAFPVPAKQLQGHLLLQRRVPGQRTGRGHQSRTRSSASSTRRPSRPSSRAQRRGRPGRGLQVLRVARLSEGKRVRCITKRKPAGPAAVTRWQYISSPYTRAVFKQISGRLQLAPTLVSRYTRWSQWPLLRTLTWWQPLLQVLCITP